MGWGSACASHVEIPLRTWGLATKMVCDGFLGPTGAAALLVWGLGVILGGCVVCRRLLGEVGTGHGATTERKIWCCENP